MEAAKLSVMGFLLNALFCCTPVSWQQLHMCLTSWRLLSDTQILEYSVLPFSLLTESVILEIISEMPLAASSMLENTGSLME